MPSCDICLEGSPRVERICTVLLALVQRVNDWDGFALPHQRVCAGRSGDDYFLSCHLRR